MFFNMGAPCPTTPNSVYGLMLIICRCTCLLQPKETMPVSELWPITVPPCWPEVPQHPWSCLRNHRQMKHLDGSLPIVTGLSQQVHHPIITYTPTMVLQTITWEFMNFMLIGPIQPIPPLPISFHYQLPLLLQI